MDRSSRPSRTSTRGLDNTNSSRPSERPREHSERHSTRPAQSNTDSSQQLQITRRGAAETPSQGPAPSNRQLDRVSRRERPAPSSTTHGNDIDPLDIVHPPGFLYEREFGDAAVAAREAQWMREHEAAAARHAREDVEFEAYMQRTERENAVARLRATAQAIEVQRDLERGGPARRARARASGANPDKGAAKSTRGDGKPGRK